MVTTAKPIIIDKQINLSQFLYKYINYYIAIWKDEEFTQGVLQKIYYGKYFVTDASRIKMNITEAIKNNINKVDWNIDTITQNWIPDNMLIYDGNSQVIPNVESIENNSKFETCRMMVYFTKPLNNSVITSVTIDITSYYSPEWYEEFNYNVPNGVNDGKIVEANRTGILPRIPYISTDKYYINFNFNRNRNSDAYYLVGDIDSGYINCVTTNVGVYNFSLPLDKLYKQIHAPASECLFVYDGGEALRFFSADVALDGGTAIIEDGDIYGGQPAYITPCSDNKEWIIEANNKPIVKVDNCYSRYYVAWFTPLGEWQSQPLDYMTVDRKNENLTFKSLRGYDYTAHTGSHGEITLRKIHLTKEEHKLYSTMMFSPYILVYDTEKDRSYLGTYQGDTNYVEQQRNSRDFEIKIKEVDNIKY